MTAINGRVFGIDPKLESAHLITDILSNNNELFLISQDNQKPQDAPHPPSVQSEGKLLLDVIKNALPGEDDSI